MTKTRLKKTVSRQTSILVMGVCILGFAVAYFSRVPLPFTALASNYRNQATATSTPKAVMVNAQKATQPKPKLSTAVSTAPAKQPAAARPATAIRGVGSLNDLLAMRESLVCTITARNSTARTGTAYVSRGEFRVDLTNSVSLISDGSHFYAWTQGATTGFVLPNTSASGSTLAFHGGLDPAQSLTYGCNHWSAQGSEFVPPTKIAFTNTSGN